jgi:hypothetical protein
MHLPNRVAPFAPTGAVDFPRDLWPPVAISFDFWHTLVSEPDGLLAELRREAVLRALIEHDVEVEDGVLEAHLAAAQALQTEAWERGEHFELPRAAAQGRIVRHRPLCRGYPALR